MEDVCNAFKRRFQKNWIQIPSSHRGTDGVLHGRPMYKDLNKQMKGQKFLKQNKKARNLTFDSAEKQMLVQTQVKEGEVLSHDDTLWV